MVLDGCGIGPMPDAPSFGDAGENEGSTLPNTARAVGGLDLPTLRSMGLGNIEPILGVDPVESPIADYGKSGFRSIGKDSVTGHWEMMGIILDRPLPTYPNGFPTALIREYEKRISTQTLGNRPASGTEIIAQLGQLHVETGFPIVYTSADSVFQVACHEAIVPIDKLYEYCQVARELLVDEHGVGRVIARPFEDDPNGGFRRTERRKDFPLPPPRNLLDDLAEAGVKVCGLGVVPELFAGRGFAYTERTQSNPEHWEALDRALERDEPFVFANFEDFDMLYGHRNDPQGFAKALEEFDARLADFLQAMPKDCELIVTADHGNDPTTPSTDHSREYVPLLWHRPGSPGRCLGVIDTLSTIAEALRRSFSCGEGLERF